MAELTTHEATHPREPVQVSGGRTVTVRRLTIRDWQACLFLFAQFVQRLALMGQQPSEEAVVADMPSLLVEVLTEAELLGEAGAEQKQAVLEFLAYVADGLDADALATMTEADVAAVWQRVWAMNRPPFALRLRMVGWLQTGAAGEASKPTSSVPSTDSDTEETS